MAATPVNTARQSARVTVGLPVYNGAAYLSRALDSLLAQDYPAFDLVVADNASTDNSLDIARSYAARDSRVRVITSPVNVGVEQNFARVLGAATGTYFMWAACDDWWDPRFISRLVDVLERRPDAVVAMCAVERVDETGAGVDVVRYAGATDPSRMTPWHLTMQLAGGRPYHLYIYGLYRREFLARAFTGFPAVIASDRLFVCRVAMAGGFAYVDEVLHRRLVRATPLAERYAGESLGRLWSGVAPRWRLALASFPYLWRSPVLPPSRRWWVPAVTLRFMKAALGHTLVQLTGSTGSVKITASTRGARSHR
jgi:glycosyltransferase involved in cell wall biosynthesis